MGRVKSLPCIVCELCGEQQTSVTEAHHIHRNPETGQPIGASERVDGFATLPLCQKKHHWNSVFVHMGSRKFERRFGNELYLLALTYERLGLSYPWRMVA
jgi:hypothetical protein